MSRNSVSKPDVDWVHTEPVGGKHFQCLCFVYFSADVHMSQYMCILIMYIRNNTSAICRCVRTYVCVCHCVHLPPPLLVGLDAAGKTTILYKLKLGEIVTTIPTIGEHEACVGEGPQR